ncbi:MAG: S8 family serine peptidase [Halobacteriota archaeon]|nr:S8 family serine peptidase [Halobacteriota archaeon]
MKKIIAILCLTTLLLSMSIGPVSGGYDDSVHFESNKVIKEKIHTELRAQLQKNPEEIITILVQPKTEKDLDRIAVLIENEGGEIKGKYKIGDVVAAKIPANRIEEIIKDRSVKSVAPNRVYRTLLEDSVPQINAPEMWDLGYDGTGVKIAILDTGIDSTHPMLSGKVILEADFTDEGHVYDVEGHGTHCAGIAAGNSGVAPGSSLINAKVMNDSGYGTDASIIAGINWCLDPDGNPATDDAVDIISMSLGGSYSDLDSPMVAAVKEAVESGVVVVIAVGNCGSGCSNCCGGYMGVTTPGNSPDAISVGAVDKNNYWATFSSGGYVNETIIKPDVVAPSVGINSSIPGGYGSNSGTSMATPHVAGAAALLLQSNPDLSPGDVKYIIEQTSIDLGEPGKDVKYGMGLIDASKFIPPNVNKILKYRLTYPQVVYKGEPVEIEVESTIGNVVDISTTITSPNNIAYSLNFTSTSDHHWSTTFTETTELGNYGMDIFILDSEGNVTEFNRNFIVKTNPADGVITDIQIPQEVPFNETMPISVVFENIGDYDYDVMVEAQILDSGSLIGSVESETRIVNAGSVSTFDLNWIANAPIGEKVIRVVASFDGESDDLEENFDIIDDSYPIITSVSFEDTFKENSPALIEVEVEDLSTLTGYISVENPFGAVEVVSLKTLSSMNDISRMVGTFFNTTDVGTYTFSINVCDSSGLCTPVGQQSFTVTGCSNPAVLVVSESEESNPERFEEVLGGSYCVNVWDKYSSGVPPLFYLERYDLVIWSTGNHWGADIDINSSALLKDYTQNGGNLVLEGPDIALSHGYGDFMENVTHSIIDDDLDLFDIQSDVSLIVTSNHPIFEGLTSSIPYNKSVSPYPDSIIPINGGVELSKWSSNESATVAFNGDGQKTLFIPFMMDALESNQNAFITNIADWMLTGNNNADLVVGDITYNYLIEGSNSIDIEIKNIGPVSATGARVDIYADGSLKYTGTTDVSSGNKVDLTIPLTLESGVQELKVELNSDINVIERNYLNNTKTEMIRVATTEADLTPISISYGIGATTVDISVQIENMGGSDTQNAAVEFWVDAGAFTTEYVNIGYGQTESVSVNWPKELGMFDIFVDVNPDQTIVESNYTNNNIDSILYVCNTSKPSVLIVDDCDTDDYSTGEPSSVDDFESVLKNNGNCIDVWNESEKGVPSLQYLNQFDMVIWSSGDYLNTVINETDVALLEQYNGGIIFEGSDIAFQHVNDSFIQNYMHSELDMDLILDDNETDLILSQHEILAGISSISINKSMCPYPDSLTPTDGISVADWDDAESAIVVYEDPDSKMVYYGFSIDAITEDETKEKLIINSVDWVGGVAGDSLVAFFIHSPSDPYTDEVIIFDGTN